MDRKRYNRTYYIKSHESIKLQQKDYYNTNKDYVLEKCREYRELNKLKINEKNSCVCGGKYTTSHKSTHSKSKKHQDYLNKMI